MPLDDHCLPLEYKPTLTFNMSCDEYIEIFNKLMSARSYTFYYFEVMTLKSFKNSYMFKRGCALSTLCIFKHKENIKYSRFILMDFNNKDLRVNPSQEGVFDAEQTNCTNCLLCVMTLLITQRISAIGKGLPRLIHNWGLK